MDVEVRRELPCEMRPSVAWITAEGTRSAILRPPTSAENATVLGTAVAASATASHTALVPPRFIPDAAAIVEFLAISRENENYRPD